MSSYTIPKARVVYEVLNTEVILIDFNTGNYYALIHVAKEIWAMIEKGFSLQHMSQLLSDHYKQDLKAILLDVQNFIEQLLEKGLIEIAEDVEPCPDPSLPIFNSAFTYETPKIQEYTDVQNLLLLDPIHEVAEVGWPDRL